MRKSVGIVSLLVAVAMICGVPVASAKRMAPRQVEPVKVEGIEYRAPTDRMGCVEAWDTKARKMIWWRQIYVVSVDPGLESDVQHVYITEMKSADGTLLINNERGSEYKMDLKTLEVQVTKGTLVLKR